MKKYEFTEETKQIGEVTLHRIRAVTDFYTVDTDGCDASSKHPPLTKIEKGTLGGWIEKEDNLSQEGVAWVADEACIYGKGHVWGAAVVSENATVDGGDIMDFARVYGKATVHRGCISDHTRIYDEAEVSGGIYADHAQVYGNATIEQEDDGELTISGNAHVYGRAKISCESNGTIEIDGDARVYGDARIQTWVDYGPIEINGDAFVCGNTEIDGAAKVGGKAVVTGHTVLCSGVAVSGNAYIDIPERKNGRDRQRIPPRSALGEGAHITDSRDCLVMSPIAGCPEDEFLTFYSTEQGSIRLSIGKRCAPLPIANTDLLKSMVQETKPDVPYLADLVADAAAYATSYFQRQKRVKNLKQATESTEKQP